MIIGPHSKIKLCKYCNKYFIMKHNRQVYCSPEISDCKKYARQDQTRDRIHNHRKRKKANGIKTDEEGTIGLGPHREKDPLKELYTVHKQLMIVKGTYTEARFKMEIKEMEKELMKA